jgi:type III secretory pathway component EscS
VFAVVGLVCGIVAAILNLTNQHVGVITWLLIIAAICFGIELVWAWHRGGYYHRAP